jgi:hypothetical protein
MLEGQTRKGIEGQNTLYIYVCIYILFLDSILGLLSTFHLADTDNSFGFIKSLESRRRIK